MVWKVFPVPCYETCPYHLQPEGSVAVDRFKSLQKRNIIEPRQRVKYAACWLLSHSVWQIIHFSFSLRPYRRYKLKLKEKRSARYTGYCSAEGKHLCKYVQSHVDRSSLSTNHELASQTLSSNALMKFVKPIHGW